MSSTKWQILVDGVLAGKWDSTKIEGKDIWADGILVVKPELNQRHNRVNVRQEFISSLSDFNEFRYEVDSLVDGQWIRTDVVDVGPDHPGEESAHRYLTLTKGLTLTRPPWPQGLQPKRAQSRKLKFIGSQFIEIFSDWFLS